ncbi:MAG: ABC exporter membrane fusion protein [Cyanobacteriota bacterium]|nr:ABC exporter membrane fusion protein [Cyanobacteriota bacterium]
MGHQPGTKEQVFSKLVMRWVIALVVAGAIATGITAYYSINVANQRSSNKLIPAADDKPPVRGVTALGRLEPSGEVIRLSATTSLQAARLAQLLVAQGDEVRAEQVIAVLDNRDRLQSAVETAQKQVTVAQANLQRVRAGAQTRAIGAQEATVARLEAELSGRKETQQATLDRLQAEYDGQKKAQQATIDRLQAELENAQKELGRYEQLAQDGAIAQSVLDSRQLTVATAKERLREAEANRDKALATLNQQIKEASVTRNQTVDVLDAQIREEKATLDQIKEVRPVDIQEAEARVESAIASVKQAQADLALAYVRAPAAGRILKIHTRAGETIDEKQGIAELGKTDEMMVVAEVYESDIRKVRLGQRVTINSESKAFEGELQGSVTQIGLQIGKKDILSTDPAAATDARVVEVNVRLNPEDSKRVASLTYSKVIVEILL